MYVTNTCMILVKNLKVGIFRKSYIQIGKGLFKKEAIFVSW